MTVAPGRLTGLDLDRVVLDDRHAEASVPAIESPVSVTSLDTTSIDARIDATRSATWLVLPQSHNDGWTLAVGGDDFGAPQLINGYANGWLIPAGADDRAIELRWTPQGSVDISLLVSAGFGLSLLAIIGFTTWRRRPAAVPLGVASADDRVGRPPPPFGSTGGVDCVGRDVSGGRWTRRRGDLARRRWTEPVGATASRRALGCGRNRLRWLGGRQRRDHRPRMALRLRGRTRLAAPFHLGRARSPGRSWLRSSLLRARPSSPSAHAVRRPHRPLIQCPRTGSLGISCAP